jgi:hypothetical protein
MIQKEVWFSGRKPKGGGASVTNGLGSECQARRARDMDQGDQDPWRLILESLWPKGPRRSRTLIHQGHLSQPRPMGI